jgi:acyl-CoA thioesterase-1
MIIRFAPRAAWAAVAAGAIMVSALAPAHTQQRVPQAGTPVCAAPAELFRLDYALTRTSRRLAAGAPLTIVAIGSSSTGGAGASSPAASYPSRLEIELAQRFPTHTVKVLNRGANGEDASEMLARFEESVVGENPDLVLWQVGTNSLLLDRPLERAEALIREGLGRLKGRGIDVVLIDPQFAPKVLAKPGLDQLMHLYSLIAKRSNVGTFHRFAVMRHWSEVAGIPFNVFLSPDELHMNDWSYACIAKLLASAIAEAATRPSAVAQTPSLPATPVGGGRR